MSSDFSTATLDAEGHGTFGKNISELVYLAKLTPSVNV